MIPPADDFNPEEAQERIALASVVYNGVPAIRSEPHDPHSTRELFLSGSYTEAVLDGDRNTLEYFASLAMIGKKAEALAGLSQFNSPDALLYSGIAHWIDGDEKNSLEYLEQVEGEFAQRLVALIKKPFLMVLGLMHKQGTVGANLTEGFRSDPKFLYHNIGYEPGDLRDQPYANIHDYYSPKHPPDFFIAREVEWYNFPLNLQELPCPILGHTSDFDAHVHTVRPYFNLFDELIVSNHFERNFLAPAVNAAVCTFPKCYAVPDFFLEPIPARSRDFDLFVSGNTIIPYHPDKAVVLNQLLSIPEDEANIRMEGFTSFERYRELMSGSKVGVVYVRDYGGMPTRALEALSVGCAVVVQRGCTLSLFLGEEDGVFLYSADKSDVREVVNRILRDWPNSERKAQRGREFLQKEFNRPRIASQYLRFLTVLAAKPRAARKIVAPGEVRQKRLHFMFGFKMPENHFRELHNKSVHLLLDQLKSNPQVNHILDIARDKVLLWADEQLKPAADTATNGNREPSPSSKKDFDEAMEFYFSGLKAVPQALIIHFNLIRCSLHFGTPDQVSDALYLAENVVSTPPELWQIDPKDDVFTYDFFPNMFNYRTYHETIIKFSDAPEVGQVRLIATVLASIHYYLSFYREGPEHAEQAATLDPEFPIYKYRYALKLIERGQGDDIYRAGRILFGLAKSSLVFEEAYQQLEKLESAGLFIHKDFAMLRGKMELVRKRIVERGVHGGKLVEPARLQPAAPEREKSLTAGG